MWCQGIIEGNVVGAQIDTVPGTARPAVSVHINTRLVSAAIVIDENHARALILLLEAVVAEVQARAVSVRR